MTTLNRRNFLIASGSACALAALPAGFAHAGSVPPLGRITYEIERKGDVIGRHTMTLSRAADQLIARNEIGIEVRMFGFVAFRYEHSSREVLDADGIVELESKTNDDGTQEQLQARRAGSRLKVDGTAGRRELTGRVLTTSLWHPDTTRKRELLDIEDGALARIAPAGIGTETLDIPALGRVACRKYALNDDVQRTVWYDDAGRLLAASCVSKKDGSHVMAKATEIARA